MASRVVDESAVVVVVEVGLAVEVGSSVECSRMGIEVCDVGAGFDVLAEVLPCGSDAPLTEAGLAPEVGSIFAAAAASSSSLP